MLPILPGVICFFFATRIKCAMGYDDSLDVFGIHAIGGQVVAQGIGVVATMFYTFIVSFIVLKIIDKLMGLRVTEESEEEGLDLSSHDERGYIL